MREIDHRRRTCGTTRVSVEEFPPADGPNPRPQTPLSFPMRCKDVQLGCATGCKGCQSAKPGGAQQTHNTQSCENVMTEFMKTAALQQRIPPTFGGVGRCDAVSISQCPCATPQPIGHSPDDAQHFATKSSDGSKCFPACATTYPGCWHTPRAPTRCNCSLESTNTVTTRSLRMCQLDHPPPSGLLQTSNERIM